MDMVYSEDKSNSTVNTSILDTVLDDSISYLLGIDPNDLPDGNFPGALDDEEDEEDDDE